MKDWKTTICGVLGAVGTYFANSSNGTLIFIGQIMSSVALLLMGYHSKDK